MGGNEGCRPILSAKTHLTDVLGEKFALGEVTKDSEPLKSSFFMVSRVSFVNRASVSRAFMLSFVLFFSFFFSSIECHMCRQEQKEKSISLRPILI